MYLPSFETLAIFPIKRRQLRISSILGALFFLIQPSALAWPKGKPKIKPATDEQIFLYRGIGSSFVCNARAADIEFAKAVGVSAATYVQLLNGRHDGRVAAAGKKKLTNKQLFSGAEFQILTGALQYCPKEVPDDVRDQVEKAIKSQKK